MNLGLDCPRSFVCCYRTKRNFFGMPVCQTAEAQTLTIKTPQGCLGTDTCEAMAVSILVVGVLTKVRRAKREPKYQWEKRGLVSSSSFSFFLVILEAKFRGSSMLGKRSTTSPKG